MRKRFMRTFGPVHLKVRGSTPRTLEQSVRSLFAAGEPKFRTGEAGKRLEKRPQRR
jgi:hypothetical protein